MKWLGTKIVKRVLWAFLILWCSGIFLNGYVGIGDHAYAQAQWSDTNSSTTQTSKPDEMGMRQVLNILLKVLYLLLWPLLVLAGLALDNTLVYASVFKLDAPLRQFWNMMKNFANFTLGFMVLYAIIKSIFSNTWQWSFKDEKSPLGIIKVTLIAGILVQASRFLLAALVDISTIATYAIGGLPLNVIKNTDLDKNRILPINSSIDLNKFNLTFAGGEEFKVRYSVTNDKITYPGNDKTVNISPCRIAHNYVVWREFGDPMFDNIEKLKSMNDPKFMGMQVCALYGDKLVMRNEGEFFSGVISTLSWCQITWWKNPCDRTTSAGYKNAMQVFLENTTWRFLNPAYTGKLVDLNLWDAALATWDAFFSWSNTLSLSTIIQKSKGFVWPLVTMYASLLNFTELTSSSVTSVSGTSGIFIIKALVAIALFFPLIALALVLIARIGVLRLYIVGSPFIVLKESFKLKMGKLDTYLSFSNVLGIVFAPVITVAALSLSLIFMTALTNGFSSSATKEAVNDTLNIQTITPINTGNDAVSVGWLTSLEFTKLPRGKGMDRFSRLMINCFGIGLMRMIFFAAIKSNELGKKVWGQVEKIGGNIFKTLPIIPIGPEGKGVGIGSMGRVLSNAPTTFTQYLNREQEGKVSEWLGMNEAGENKGGKSSSAATITWEQIDTTINALKTSPETAKNYLNEQKITPTTFWATENTKFFNVLNNTLNSTATPLSTSDKKTLLENTNKVLWTDRYKNQAKALIDNNSIIKAIKADTKEPEIAKTLNNGTPKTDLDTYFNNVLPTPTDIETITSDWTKLKISKAADAKTYVWTTLPK